MEGHKVESKLQERINLKNEWSTSWTEQFSTLLVRTFKQHQTFLWWKSELWTEAQLRAQGVGELMGAAVPDIKWTGLVASIVLLVFMITGGFYIQYMPVFIAWLKYVSFVFYGFRFVVKMHYSPHRIYNCTGPGGCESLQISPNFETKGLYGGMQEVWILIPMAFAYRIMACFYLNKIKLI